ncbi:MAG: redoxin domain-containing protein [Idiomarina sp.]|nr:redoxin domain-containing protein [Idiomarina sp.]
MSQVHSIQVTTINGELKSLSDYEGKVLLVVNVASKCGLTPQYEQLEKLYEEKRSEGFEVLGFPCNQFAGQEPGTEQEIQEFCRATFGVQFPMFGKIEVNGEARHPLYQTLIQAQPQAVRQAESRLTKVLQEKGLASEKLTDVMWNFEKFLVGRDGQVLGRFAPDITVADEPLASAIEKALK